MAIIDELIVERRPGVRSMNVEERANAEVARAILALRKRSRLTQAELARRIGTTASVISRLEDADYDGLSLAMLQRIAAALGRRVRISFVPVRSRDAA